jgi:sugar lactone lactonase YvrE
VPHTEVMLDGLYFGEGPRQGPDGRLYVSDFYAHEVLAVDLATGTPERVCQVPGQPSGLGWLPDGRLLVVSMLDRAVWRLEPNGRMARHADLATVATFHANDMLVDPGGRAYVGNFGFDLHSALAAQGAGPLLAPDADPPGAALALVRPDGEVQVVAEDLKFPNGTVLLDDTTLVVAESLGMRLTAFDVAEDGALHGRRVWADLRERSIVPDGTCLDAEGGIWVATALENRAYRVTEGGRITDAVETDQPCFAVALAGVDRRTLVCCTAPSSMPGEVAVERLGRLETVRVTVPGTG